MMKCLTEEIVQIGRKAAKKCNGGVTGILIDKLGNIEAHDGRGDRMERVE